MNALGLPPRTACSPTAAMRAPCTSAGSPCSTSGRTFEQRQPRRSRQLETGRRQMALSAIRAKENYDASFELAEDNRTALNELLGSDTFCAQVAVETKLEQGRQLQFTEMLFQPMPWSINTKKGMPAEYEQYLDESYVFINVPPNFMFQAKIFKPSRLCAIYETA